MHTADEEDAGLDDGCDTEEFGTCCWADDVTGVLRRQEQGKLGCCMAIAK